MDIKRLSRATGFAARLTASALIALGLAQALSVRLPLWVVLTAMLVSQTSVGRSLKATFDYFAGTLLGALWGVIIVTLVPQTSEAAVLVALGLALMPLGTIAALEPRCTAAPITAAIIVLGLQITHLGPASSAMERVIEVGLGGVVGLVVSFVLFPSSAFQLVRDKAADVLMRMADAAQLLLLGTEKGLAPSAIHNVQIELGELLNALTVVVAEADRERRVRLGHEDGAPLFRALLRLRHDLIMIGRAVEKPLPAAVSGPLYSAYQAAARVLHAHFTESAQALRAHKSGPVLDAVDSAIEACAAELETARRADVLRGLSSDELENLFAMSFALDQMRRNLADLKLRIDDWGA